MKTMIKTTGIMNFIFIYMVFQITNAEGPPLIENSFEDLVHGSTHVIIGKVISKQEETDSIRHYVKATIKIVRKVKGDIVDSTIILICEITFPWNVDINVGMNYLLFLKNHNSSNYYIYSKPYWTCWKVDNDSVKTVGGLNPKNYLPLNSFIKSIQEEQKRSKVTLPTKLMGIKLGDSLSNAMKSSGLTFIRYKNNWGNNKQWLRYYCLLPKDSNAHMVRINLYKNRIVFLGIYYLSCKNECLKMPINDYVDMCGGIRLFDLNEINYFIGRRWYDENVEVEMVGNFGFIKSNGYPWGKFNACYISLQDKKLIKEK